MKKITVAIKLCVSLIGGIFFDLCPFVFSVQTQMGRTSKLNFVVLFSTAKTAKFSARTLIQHYTVNCMLVVNIERK